MEDDYGDAYTGLLKHDLLKKVEKDVQKMNQQEFDVYLKIQMAARIDKLFPDKCYVKKDYIKKKIDEIKFKASKG